VTPIAPGKPRPPLPPDPFLVVGLARSGETVALALRERGHEVIGLDSGPAGPALEQTAGRLSAAGVEVHLDAAHSELPPDRLATIGTLVKSPGVPREAPVVQAAERAGVPVLGELELAWRMLPNRFIAVTGTNGKTTTTEWLGHLFRTAGAPVGVAGNVGTALSGLIDRIDSEAAIVCEASSFQLEDTAAFAPEVAVLLNLTPDHLDRHGTFEAYREAKLRIFANQEPDGVAVLPEALEDLDPPGRARRVEFGRGEGCELRLSEDWLYWGERELLPVEEIRLPGEHNRHNAMAAAAAALAAGVDPEAVAEGLRSFVGVPHRLELVAVRNGVAYVNDSKATNVASTLVALRSYAGAVHLIAGGRGKAQDFAPLAPVVAERCAAVYLIGEDAPVLAVALRDADVPVHRVGRLERALALAGRQAGQGETVLLSPACASFDQFRDFEARGDAFRALVLGSGL
jgi:UDP-N-acetylmuramoylalanine--D-glutamate ligase